MADKPKPVAWFVDEPVDPADPLAAVKERARVLCSTAHMAERSAARLEEAAGLFGCESMDPATVWDTGLAAGLTGADLDAAAYVSLTLRCVELDQGR